MKYSNLGTMNASSIRWSMAASKLDKCLACISCLELGDSFQKHILRVYIMKYSNLGTMNALSIRWSMAASKLDDECGRLCCNLLDAALACSNLAP
jgi:hypothetical protein